jgi:hypothetical protein
MGPALRALLSPLALGALCLLLVNDHVLKPTMAGWLTGKLSGVAGLALTPFVLFALLELAVALRPGIPQPGRRAAAVLTAATAGSYAAVELVPAATEAYRWMWGALQLPFRTAADLLTGGAVTGIVPVSATADPSDLLALPAVLALLIVLSRDSRGEARRADA